MSDSPSGSPTPADGALVKLVGTTISGRYKVESLLGSGGMGSVYLVQHTHMRKRFALKILNSQTAQNPEMVARFEREAMAAAHIEHPNVTVAIDFGKADDGSFFLVLEYLEGKRLRDAMDAGPLELRRAMHIVRQIASALERSHELGVVHRDLKPENIMLVSRQGDRDFVKVLDFGLAKVATGLMEPGGDGKAQALTKLGTIFGTPKYMAPEQCVSGTIDGRTDLYALGLILYEMLTGVHPFTGKDNFRLIMHQINTPTPQMKTLAPAVAIPASLEAVVMRLTEKEPDKRFASAAELLTALDEVAEKEGISPPEPSTRIATTPSRSAPALKPPDTTGQTVNSIDLVSVVDMASPKPANSSFAGGSPGGSPPVKNEPAAQPSVKSEPPAPPAALPSGSIGGFEATDKPKPAAPLSAGPARSDVGSLLRPLTERLPEPLKRVNPFLLLGVPIALLGIVVFLSVRSGSSHKADHAAAKVSGKRAAHTVANPEEAKKQRQLAQNYVAQKNGADALRSLAMALSLDKNSITAADIQPAAALTMNTPDSTEETILLLESKLGAPGVDVIYALEARTGQSPLKTRLSQSLSKPEVRTLASRAALIALDMRTAEKCEARRALLPRAAREGDERTLEQLQLMAQRQNCGPLGLLDCWPCLRKDTALQKAIASIEARVKTRD